MGMRRQGYQHLNKQLEALLKITAAVLEHGELDPLLSTITHELKHMLDFDRSSVALLSPKKDHLILRDICKGKPGERFGEGRVVPLKGTNVIGWAALERKPIMRNDIKADKRFSEVVKEEHLQSDIIIPLVANRELVGTLNVGSYRKDAFSNSDFEVMKNCGKFICLTIEYIMLLKEARELGIRYKTLQDNANDSIMIVDKKTGRIIEANRKSESLLGYSHQEILRKSFMDLFAREELYQARRDFINILSGRSLSFFDRKMITKSNRIVFVDIHANLINISDDTIVQIVIHDITQRKMLENQIISQNIRLEQANAKLKEVDRMKTEFLANISHELRTPLSIIIAYTESLKAGVESEEEREKFLDIISENGEILLNLINNLLDLSKLEVSGTVLNMSLSHINEVIKSLWPQVEVAAEKKGIKLELDLDEGIPITYFDNGQISKVLYCLVHNAIKFTDRGGKVKVSSVLKDGEIHVKVSDTGAGIPYEAIPHIFSTFRQVDGSSSRRWGGLGIGLAIAKHMISLHRGRLWVESEVGKGSEFTFSLPLDTEKSFLDEGIRTTAQHATVT